MHWLSILASQPRLLRSPKPRRHEPEPEIPPFTERRAEAWRQWAAHNPTLRPAIASLAASGTPAYGLR